MKKLLTLLVLFSFGGTVLADSPLIDPFKRRAVYKPHRSALKIRVGARRAARPSRKTPFTPKTEFPPAAVAAAAAPVVVPSASASDDAGVLSGNAVVPINTGSNAVIKIGLSPHGIALIDFPSDDPVYEIHPADENYVTIGCRRRGKSDDPNDPKKLGRCTDSPNDSIILRPGTAFNEWADGVDASTVVTVQRVSGLVVPIIIVPVKKVSQNANYVAIRYDVQKVIEARRLAGLPFNLNIPTSPVAGSVAADEDSGSASGYLPAKLESSGEPSKNTVGSGETNASPELLAEVRRAAATKPLLKFSRPVHGIALALVSRSLRTTENSIDVVAVKNTLGVPIRLTPVQPNLVIETMGEKNKGSVLSRDVIVAEIVANTEADDVLSPGRVYYFALSYKTPILGAKQSLWASFAHRTASDEPATLMLGEPIK